MLARKVCVCLKAVLRKSSLISPSLDSEELEEGTFYISKTKTCLKLSSEQFWQLRKIFR